MLYYEYVRVTTHVRLVIQSSHQCVRGLRRLRSKQTIVQLKLLITIAIRGLPRGPIHVLVLDAVSRPKILGLSFLQAPCFDETILNSTGI